MIFLKVVQILSVVFAVWILFGQIAWPMIKGTKLFPMFQRERRLTDADRAEAMEALENARKRRETREIEAAIREENAKSAQKTGAVGPDV